MENLNEVAGVLGDGAKGLTERSLLEAVGNGGQGSELNHLIYARSVGLAVLGMGALQ